MPREMPLAGNVAGHWCGKAKGRGQMIIEWLGVLVTALAVTGAVLQWLERRALCRSIIELANAVDVVTRHAANQRQHMQGASK